MSNSNIIFFLKLKKLKKILKKINVIFQKKIDKKFNNLSKHEFHECNTNLEIVGLYDVIAWVTTIALVSFK